MQPKSSKGGLRRMIRRKQVLELIGMARTALDEAVRRGDFPKPCKVFAHGRATAWDAAEVEAWQAARFAARKEKK